jgi:hypothetical protein
VFSFNFVYTNGATALCVSTSKSNFSPTTMPRDRIWNLAVRVKSFPAGAAPHFLQAGVPTGGCLKRFLEFSLFCEKKRFLGTVDAPFGKCSRFQQGGRDHSLDS